MSGRGRSSFTKRQKERSRQDKQREKAERKSQRKAEKGTGEAGDLDSNLEVLVDSSTDPFARNLGTDFVTETDQEE
ncbi:MAG TPA: hypothetical protein VE083_12830 [Terriglobales bacterium]|nr:hypothetical protein [Terriglobales bacterium]